MSTQDVSRLAELCPNLERCCLPLQPGAQTTALAQLTRLTALTLWRQRSSIKSDNMLKQLASLSRLRELQLHCADTTLSAADLVPLRPLKQLRRLECGGCAVDCWPIQVRCLNLLLP
jgi:hypothetical protein